MKTKEEIYLDEVKKATELDEKFGKILMSDAIRKFTLNCIMKTEDQFRQPIVSGQLPLKRWTCRLWDGQIDKVENSGGQFVEYDELVGWLKGNFR